MATRSGTGHSARVLITGGTVNMGSGDIVGGNKMQYISQDLDGVFGCVAPAIETVAPDQRMAAIEQLRALNEEAPKGKDASDSVVANLVNGLTELVPGAVAAVVGAFASPIWAGLAGPRHEIRS